MSALEQAKAMGAEAVIEKIAASGLKEYGVYHIDLAEKWRGILAGAEGPIKVCAALNNSDTTRALLGLLKTDTEKVLEGIAVTAFVMGSDTMILQVPAEEEELKNQIATKAQAYGIEVVNAFVKAAEYRGHALHHIETMAAVADIINDCYVPGVHLAVCSEGTIGELQKVTYGTRLADIADLSDAKAVEISTHLYTPAAAAELVVDENLNTGNGVITVIPKTACLIHEGESRLFEARKNGCGKCTFCREGLYQLEAHMKDITSGKGRKEGLAMMQEIGEAMGFSCGCSVGTVGADFVLDSMKYFMDEFDAHIKKKSCPAGVCKSFQNIYIDPSLCTGCGDCIDVCPEDCIEGKAGYIHMIEAFDCTRCGKCIDACKYDAVVQTTGRVPKLPKRLTKCGKFKTRKVAEENKMETDVVIVAAGPAGLAAAITAGENDLKAVVFEKSNTTGGAANMGMGPLGIGTKIQKKEFKDLSLEEAYDIHMKYTHYRVDGDLVQTYFEKSADTIDWLQDMGVEFAGAFKYFTESAATWHIVKPENGVIGPRAAGPMVRIMTERAKELGADIFLETPVKSLIMEDGKCVGVIAVDKDGKEIEARGKAVVVATGGFGTNAEMLKKEFGLDLWKNFFPFNVPGTNGEGLRMMWDAGAMKWGANIEMIYQLKDNLSHFVLDACMRQPALLVNQRGYRFLDEGQMGNTTFTGNAINLQPGKCAYSIMDRNLIKYYAKNGPDIFDIVHPEDCFFAFEHAAKEALETGYDGYFEADTIEELAEKMGIDPDTLSETLENYNEMCAENLDTQFHKNPRFLHPITGRKGGFIAARFYIAAYGTIGGVRTNKYGEVLDENLNPIPGLYSAGSDCNTIYGDSYNFTLPGNTMGFAINSGRMAAEAIVDYIDEMDE